MESSEIESILKISSSTRFPQFLHECCDDLIGKKTSNADNHTDDLEWTADDTKKTRKFIQMFYCECVTKNSFEINMDIAQNVRNALRDCYEIRKVDIKQFLMKESIIKKGHNLVDNFDWKLKWIMGSSSLASIREPIFQLDLRCIQNDFNGAKNLENNFSFEMDLSQTDKMIELLENMQKEFDSK